MSTFSDQARVVFDWIDRYLSHAGEYRVLSKVQPGEITAALPADAPEDPEAFEKVFEDFERIIMPGITHWNHPRFFAYFAISAAPVAVLADALAAALDVNAMLWRTSPSATELEEVVLRWLQRLFGFPDSFSGIVYDTASIGGFTALAAARESLDLEIRERGMIGRALPPLHVYITEHTHSHLEKGAIALGVGRQNVIKIPCDERNQMRPDALKGQIEADIAGGKKPMCICATIGTTSSTSVDPLPEIAKIAQEYNVWLHVDAAYAGIAAILPEFRQYFAGIEHADSIVVNPHKWMFVPIDFSALYIKDMQVLERAFSLVADYLVTPESGVRNYMDYGLQLGRRFRALKMWFVLRTYGANGIREKIRTQIALAQEFASWVKEEDGWEIMAPHPFSVVCFRHVPPRYGADPLDEAQSDAHNLQIVEHVNATGKVFLSSTKLDGRVVIRLAIGNIRTSRNDVLLAWDLLRQAATASV